MATVKDTRAKGGGWLKRTSTVDPTKDEAPGKRQNPEKLGLDQYDSSHNSSSFKAGRFISSKNWHDALLWTGCITRMQSLGHQPHGIFPNFRV